MAKYRIEHRYPCYPGDFGPEDWSEKIKDM